jgi:hypothetical protein
MAIQQTVEANFEMCLPGKYNCPLMHGESEKMGSHLLFDVVSERHWPKINDRWLGFKPGDMRSGLQILNSRRLREEHQQGQENA